MPDSGPLNVAGLLFILLFVAQLATVIRAYKGFILKSTRIMTSVSLRSGKALLLVGGTVVLFCAVFQPLLTSWIPPLSRVLQAGLGMVALGGACLPPGIVYLGGSQSSGFLFVRQLMFAIAPLKVTHLLNSFEAGVMLGDQAHMSEYRVTTKWQEVVRSLCDIAPLIILDSRHITAPVLQEAQYILNSDQRRRTVFIAEDNGTVPLLNGLYDGGLLTLTPQAAIASCNGLGWKTLTRGRKALDEVIGDGTLLR